MRFSANTVLVTGGTGGLGRAVSLAFLAEGARVLVTYVRDDEFANLRRAAGNNSSALRGYRVDLTDETSVNEFVGNILTEYGQIDAIVNTVGGYAGGLKFWESDSSVFDKMLALNLRAGLLLLRAVAPAMVRRGHGSIVNVASKAAVQHDSGASAYAASKAAALAMVDSLAEDLKGTGVRANTILPSIIDTEANRKAMPGADFEKWPKPEDLAKVILFLCSSDAKVIHGAALPVYGNS